MTILKKIVPLCIGIFIIISCSSSSDDGPDTNDNFDRAALLTNMADNIIIPALVNFQSEMSDLDTARSTFVNDISQTNLDALSVAWLDAYKTWQNVEMFNIGLAETLSVDANSGFGVLFNRYPLSVSELETNVSSGSYDFEDTNLYDTQGFPALDFLIHGVANSDLVAIDKFTTNANADNYIIYLTDIVSRMQTALNNIVNDWQGSFRNSFVNNTSSSATGSVNKIVNDFIVYYEKALRANKIGIPAGNFSNAPIPSTVEAFHKKDVSKELALASLDAVVKIFNGQSLVGGATSGESFASYLEALNRGDLKTQIDNQFQEAKEKLTVLDDNFVNQINTDNSKMTEAYDALQGAVILLKVDMASAFNVVIDFQDSDGD